MWFDAGAVGLEDFISALSERILPDRGSLEYHGDRRPNDCQTSSSSERPKRLTRSKRQTLQPGDVLRIPLPDGRYAFGRVYKDASIGVYRQVSGDPNAIPVGSREFLFNVGVYEDVVKSGTWPVVAHDAFQDADEAWPPPNVIRDVLSGEVSIYHRGEIRPASGEVDGLEEAAVWDSDDIINRILESTGPKS